MVDTIAEAEGISMNSVSFKALFGKGYIGDVPVILAKPQTFMNLSGESICNMEVIHVNNYNFQLDFTLHRGLEAVRIILLEGFDKGATFVNTAKKIEQIG
ncbi:Peptidyl-tRNA hydrolase family protein [Trifolium repens]|nr:Peptidyl-tRNA hydrolase family protein [Trifolium repens]